MHAITIIGDNFRKIICLRFPEFVEICGNSVRFLSRLFVQGKAFERSSGTFPIAQLVRSLYIAAGKPWVRQVSGELFEPWHDAGSSRKVREVPLDFVQLSWAPSQVWEKSSSGKLIFFIFYFSFCCHFFTPPHMSLVVLPCINSLKGASG